MDLALAHSSANPSESFRRMSGELLEGPQGGLSGLYQDWLRGRGSSERQPDIHSLVHSLGHGHLDRITGAEMRAATRWSSSERDVRHALGNSRGTAPHRWIDDFDTPWTFSYQLHLMMDQLGRIPWWPEFHAWFVGEGRSTYYEPVQDAYRRLHRDKGDEASFGAALRWRVGCGYYSFLREVHLYSALRIRYGLPMRYHVFADVQLRTDMWCGRSLVAVYVENGRFRAGEEGRKRFLGDIARRGGFHPVEVRLGKPTGFGSPHLVEEAEIARVAAEIRARNAGECPGTLEAVSA